MNWVAAYETWEDEEGTHHVINYEQTLSRTRYTIVFRRDGKITQHTNHVRFGSGAAMAFYGEPSRTAATQRIARAMRAAARCEAAMTGGAV